VSLSISTDMLQQLVANAKDEDKGPPCVALLLRLPKTADNVAAFLQQPGAGEALALLRLIVAVIASWARPTQRCMHH
jgi:hypothetical protein